jgi:hypothetical protein
MYVDDSGTKEYSPTKTYSTKGGCTPYFAFGGLLLTPAEAGTASVKMRALKLACFGSEHVEIKANWLRVEKERKKRYLDPYGIDDSKLNAFVEDVYSLILSLDCKLIAAIVVKPQMHERYGDMPWYAPAVAYECLMQRVQLEMEERDGTAHITVDDMDGATPKGKQYRDNLERHHHQMATNGSRLRRGMIMNRLAGISFADSKADERLQLADLVTYSVYRQFVDNAAAWDATGTSELPTYAYLGRLGPKFRSFNGVIAGFGIVKFPTVTRNRWAIKTEP